MTKPIDIITSALQNIGALAAGEPVQAAEANDGLVRLNRLIDQLSNEMLIIPYITEIIFPLQANLKSYTLGPEFSSPPSTFVGSIAGDQLLITAITSGAPTLNQTIKGTGIVSGTRITAFGPTSTSAGGTGWGLGIYTVFPPQTASSTVIQAFYQRPLQIQNAFVRVASLDYPVSILTEQEYSLIGLKNLNGSWPRALYYQPTMPRSNVTVWPVPTQASEMHLFANVILATFETLQDEIVLAPGYDSMLEWNLSKALLPSYGMTDPQILAMIMDNAATTKGNIKRTNSKPQQPAMFDQAIVSRDRTDAGWFLSGGFN